MLTKSGLNYTKTQIKRPDGTFYNVIEVTVATTDIVAFHKAINESRGRKLDDVIHLRTLKALDRGVKHPVILAWDAYPHGELAQALDLEPTKLTNNLVYISKNSLITHHLRYLLDSRNYMIDKGILKVKEIKTGKDKLCQELLATLYAEDRIRLAQSDRSMSMQEVYESFDPKRDLIAVGRLGFPSTFARETKSEVVFNTSYFLFEDEDYISDFSLFGDAYNLNIRDGIIESPPLYNRSCLVFKSDGTVDLTSFSLQDLKANLLGKTWDLDQYQVYTRYSTVAKKGQTLSHSPQQEGFVHFVIIDQSIVGYKQNGGVEIPHNGFVLALPLDQLPQGTVSNQVSYAFTSGETYQGAIQAGPGLLQAGEVILNKDTLVQEQFFRKRILNRQVVDYGVVPTDYAPDIDETRAARTAIGVGPKGEFKVLVVESVNQGMAEAVGESSGVTLQEMALLAKSKDYQYALNLDGGGSATIDYMYGKLVKGADRRGLPGVMYERMVPSVGVICLSKNGGLK